MENSLTKTVPQPRRFRFFLIAGLIALGLVGGWVLWQSRLAQQLDREKAFIESRGGVLYFADEIGETGELIEGPIERGFIARLSRAPLNINLHKVQKVRECLDIASTYHGLWQIDLSESDIKDEDRITLAGMQELRHLLISDTQVSDALLTAISGLPNLETLDVSRTKISASGLAKWRPPQSLKALMLNDCEIAEGSLRCIKDHAQLEILRLCDTATNSKCLLEVGKLIKLKELDLSGTKVDEASIPVLIDMPKLEELRVADTMFSVGGVTKLAEKKTRLILFDLSRLPISEDALLRIGNGKALVRLTLSGTPLTDEMTLQLFDKRVVRDLAVDNTKLTAEGLIRLVEHSHLNRLEVTERLLSEKDRVYIKSLRKDLELIEIPAVTPSQPQ